MLVLVLGLEVTAGWAPLFAPGRELAAGWLAALVVVPGLESGTEPMVAAGWPLMPASGLEWVASWVLGLALGPEPDPEPVTGWLPVPAPDTKIDLEAAGGC